jgi:hypothetical protein
MNAYNAWSRFNWTVVVISVATGAGSPAFAQPAFSVPAPVAGHLQRALSAARSAYGESYSEKQIQAAGDAFARELDLAGTLVTPELAEAAAAAESRDISAKLITIAWDRRTRPQVYQEIDREYLRKVNVPGSVAPRSPDPHARHSTEAYRLVWEYTLLRPPAQYFSDRYERSALRALSHINNPATLLTLLLNYSMTVVGDAPSSPLPEDRQRALLMGLTLLPDRETLRVILQCVSLSEAQHRRAAQRKDKKGEPEWRPWDVAGFVSTLMGEGALAPQWKRILASYPRTSLRGDQVKVFSNARKGDR